MQIRMEAPFMIHRRYYYNMLGGSSHYIYIHAIPDGHEGMRFSTCLRNLFLL